MGGVERVGDLDCQCDHLLKRERAPLQARAERLPLEELHDEVRNPVRLADVVDRADVRVVEGRGGLRLPREPRADRRIGEPVPANELERDRSLEAHVGRAEDFAHSALPERAVDAVRTEMLEAVATHACRVVHGTAKLSIDESRRLSAGARGASRCVRAYLKARLWRNWSKAAPALSMVADGPVSLTK